MKETKYRELKTRIISLENKEIDNLERIDALEERLDTWDHRLAKWASRQSLEELPSPVKPKGADRKKMELE